MQCCDPRLIRVESYETGYAYFTFIPCGKCYGCRCNSRAEWAVRMRYEMSDIRNKSAFFITLTYDDAHLPLVTENNRFLLDYLQCKPYADRDYSFCYLEKQHFSVWIKNCQEWLRNYTHDDSLMRYYLTGEYGDISHRCHGHSICIFPCNFHKQDIINMCKQTWEHGFCYVGDTMSAAACNYVAKHQVKDCCGNEFQQVFAPIFALSTRYRGGIGRTLCSDNDLYNRWLSSRITNEPCTIDQIQGQVVYKVSIPRFATRKWHPERFDDEELQVLQEKSIKNLKKFLLLNGANCEKVNNLVADTFRLCKYEQQHFAAVNNFSKQHDIAAALKQVCEPLRIEDEQRKQLYITKHKTAKIKQLVNNSINYNHY